MSILYAKCMFLFFFFGRNRHVFDMFWEINPLRLFVCVFALMLDSMCFSRCPWSQHSREGGEHCCGLLQNFITHLTLTHLPPANPVVHSSATSTKTSAAPSSLHTDTHPTPNTTLQPADTATDTGQTTNTPHFWLSTSLPHWLSGSSMANSGVLWTPTADTNQSTPTDTAGTTILPSSSVTCLHSLSTQDTSSNPAKTPVLHTTSNKTPRRDPGKIRPFCTHCLQRPAARDPRRSRGHDIYVNQREVCWLLHLYISCEHTRHPILHKQSREMAQSPPPPPPPP